MHVPRDGPMVRLGVDVVGLEIKWCIPNAGVSYLCMYPRSCAPWGLDSYS